MRKRQIDLDESEGRNRNLQIEMTNMRKKITEL